MSDEFVAEWIKKGEEDWTALGRLRSGALGEVADVITFLAQQCAEKYLKALIRRGGNEPPRIHHLPTLLDMLVTADPDLEVLRFPCESLTPYAVHFRYPGEEATEEDVKEALEYAMEIRAAVRRRFDLPEL